MGGQSAGRRPIDRKAIGRRGFERTAVLDSATAHELAAWIRARPAHDPDLSSDLDLTDVDERIARDQVLAAALDAPLAAILPGTRPTLRLFRRVPAGGALPAGFGASRVDERSGLRSHEVWIALEDITGHQGQLQILPGSHLVAPPLRMPRLEQTLPPLGELEPLLRTVPLSAGEALVLDAALVRGSRPNNTPVDRWWAVVELVPDGADVWWIEPIDGGHAGYERVRDGWWRSVIRSDLERTRPEPLVRRVRPVHRAAVTVPALADAARRATRPRLLQLRRTHARGPRRPSGAVLAPRPLVDLVASRTEALLAELTDLLPPTGAAATSVAHLSFPVVVDGRAVDQGARCPAALDLVQAISVSARVVRAQYDLLGASTIFEPDPLPDGGPQIHLPLLAPPGDQPSGLEGPGERFQPWVVGQPLVSSPADALRLVNLCPGPWFLLTLQLGPDPVAVASSGHRRTTAAPSR